jgi:energy-coupling factor transporter ATP-binding protein EcfA2
VGISFRKMSHFIDAEILGLAGKADTTQIRFDRHLSILYGLNGSGKTSLLKILHSAMTGDAGMLSNVPFARATVRLRSLFLHAIVTRTIDKVKVADRTPGTAKGSSTRGRGVLAAALAQGPGLEWTETIQPDEKPIPDSAKPDTQEPANSKLVSFDHRYLPTTRLYVGAPKAQTYQFATGVWTDLTATSLATRTTLTEEVLDKNFAEVLEGLWVSYTSEVGRSVRTAQAKGLANILKAVMSGRRSTPPKEAKLDLERAYESVQQFLERQGSPDVLGTFSNFSARYDTDVSLRAVVQDIYNVEQEVDAATEPQKRLERLVQMLYSGNKRVIFSEKSILVESGTGERIGLESLSSGEKHLMRMFVECLGAGPNAILIDEPELSVHIDWQRDLMEILQSLNREAQFVVATHSPEIMAEVPDEKLFSL